MDTKIMNLEEVAKLLGVSERTILRLLESKELTGFKVGRAWKFTQADIDAFIENQRKKAESGEEEE